MGLMAVATALSAGSQIAGHFEEKKATRKAERKQDEANRISSVSAQVRNSTQRRKAIAQARIAQAQNMANAGSAVESSSALQGVQSGIAGQLGSNIGAQNQLLGSQQNAFNFQQGAQDTLSRGRQRSGDFAAIGQLANFAAQNFSIPTSPQVPGGVNMQGQETALTNNTAFVKRM